MRNKCYNQGGVKLEVSIKCRSEECIEVKFESIAQDE